MADFFQTPFPQPTAQPPAQPAVPAQAPTTAPSTGYTPLTPQQYQAAITAGFKPEEIIANEKKRKQDMAPAATTTPTSQPGYFSRVAQGVGQALTKGPLPQAFLGVAKGIGSTVAGLESVAQKGLSAITNPIAKATTGAPVQSPTATEQFGNALAPKNLAQGLGNFTEKVAELFTPSDVIAGAKDIMGGVDVAKGLSKIPMIGEKLAQGAEAVKNAPYAGKAISYITEKVLKAIPEATFGYGYGLTQSGGDTGEAKKSAATFGVLSGLGEVIGDAWRAAKGGVVDNINKAIGATGKMTPQQAAERVPKALNAFKTMANMAEDITVKTIDGVKKTWEPTKDGFYEGLQGLQGTKKNIYQAYTDLAKKAGDKGATFAAEDFSKVESKLLEGTKNATSSFVNKTKSLIEDLQRNYGIFDEKGNFTGYKPTDLTDIQSFIEKINTDVNPLSDKAGATVSDTASKTLRDIMDGKIQGSTGEGYQKLRTAYSDLKSIENDMVNQTKKIYRNVGGRVGQYVEGFGSLDTIIGALSHNPFETVRGVGMAGLGKLMNYLRDPEVGLRNAFKQITGENVGSVENRLFGAPEATPKDSALPPSTSPPKVNEAPTSKTGIVVDDSPTNKVTPQQRDIIKNLTPEQTQSYLTHKDNANAVFPKFKDTISKIQDELGIAAKTNQKGDPRAIEKAMLDYAGDFTQVGDMNRSAFSAKSIQDVKDVVDSIKQNFDVVTTKNRMLNPTNMGYRDVMFKVNMPNGMLAEIQVSLPEMEAAKKAMHAQYEITRSLEGKIDSGTATPTEIKKFNRAAQKQIDAYTKAWQKYSQDVGLLSSL